MAGKSRREMIEEMLAEDPTDPFLHYGLAMEYVSAGQLDDAIRRFQHLIGIAPDYVPAYLQVAQALVRENRPAEAGSTLRRGLEAARKKGDQHAHDEMSALLESIS